MQSIWGDAVHQALLIVLQLLLAALLAWVHSLMPLLRSWLKHHLTQKERFVLQSVAMEARAFAMHVYGEQDTQDKLNHALHYALSVLQRKGLSFTPDEVRAAIAVAVSQSAWGQKEQP